MAHINWIGLYTFIRREWERMFRVVIQTLVTPWISATLYILVFGFIVGTRIQSIAGVKYIDFVLPGILMMNVLASAFSHSSSSVYMARFMKTIEEILVAPLSHLEMIIGYIAGAIVRGIIVGLGIFMIAVLFGAANVEHPFLILFYIISISGVFGFLGMLVGLWAKNFEQLNVLNTFVITPFIFLGGVFYSIEMLPAKAQMVAQWNPFFYFVDGIRYAMIGVREGSAAIGYVLIFVLLVGLGGLVWHLFSRGWRLRE